MQHDLQCISISNGSNYIAYGTKRGMGIIFVNKNPGKSDQSLSKLNQLYFTGISN